MGARLIRNKTLNHPKVRCGLWPVAGRLWVQVPLGRVGEARPLRNLPRYLGLGRMTHGIHGR